MTSPTGSEIKMDEFEGHTPLPWYVDEACICGGPVCRAVAIPCRAEEYEGWADDDLPEAEQQTITANAKLIAQAPALLAQNRRLVEALEKIADYIVVEDADQMSDGFALGYYRAREADAKLARAAIEGAKL